MSIVIMITIAIVFNSVVPGREVLMFDSNGLVFKKESKNKELQEIGSRLAGTEEPANRPSVPKDTHHQTAGAERKPITGAGPDSKDGLNGQKWEDIFSDIYVKYQKHKTPADIEEQRMRESCQFIRQVKKDRLKIEFRELYKLSVNDMKKRADKIKEALGFCLDRSESGNVKLFEDCKEKEGDVFWIDPLTWYDKFTLVTSVKARAKKGTASSNDYHSDSYELKDSTVENQAFGSDHTAKEKAGGMLKQNSGIFLFSSEDEREDAAYSGRPTQKMTMGGFFNKVVEDANVEDTEISKSNSNEIYKGSDHSDANSSEGKDFRQKKAKAELKPISRDKKRSKPNKKFINNNVEYISDFSDSETYENTMNEREQRPVVISFKYLIKKKKDKKAKRLMRKQIEEEENIEKADGSKEQYRGEDFHFGFGENQRFKTNNNGLYRLNDFEVLAEDRNEQDASPSPIFDLSAKNKGRYQEADGEKSKQYIKQQKRII